MLKVEKIISKEGAAASDSLVTSTGKRAEREIDLLNVNIVHETQSTLPGAFPFGG